jgi:hypothetical protein
MTSLRGQLWVVLGGAISDMILIAMDNCHMTTRNGVLESTSAAKCIAIAF